MSQSTPITVIGNVVNTPIRKDLGESQVVEFRMAVNDSRVDPSTGEWIEKTSFFKVSVWRNLGTNVAESLRKGDRVIVQGNLKIREYRTEKDEPRISVEISASAVGDDLSYGIARFMKVRRNADGTQELPDRGQLLADPLVKASESRQAPTSTSFGETASFEDGGSLDDPERDREPELV